MTRPGSSAISAPTSVKEHVTPPRSRYVSAVVAASGLIDLEVCADVEALSALVPLPEDPRLRDEVKRLQKRIDRVAALSRAERTTDALALEALRAGLRADTLRGIYD